MKKSFCRYRAGSMALAIVLAAAWHGIAAPAHAGPAADRPGEATVIRFFSNRGTVSPFEIAAALGWLKDKGIRIEAQGYSQGGPESLVGLAAGAVDIAGVATPPMLNAIASGAKIIGVMPDLGTDKDVNCKFFVLADSPIKTAQDLKNKSIAVNTLGAHLDYTIREYLRIHGMSPSDVQLVAIPGPQLDQVLRHRQADVVAVGAWQSIFAGRIEAEGGVRVLFTDHQVLGDIALGNDAMEKAFIDRHPQAIRDFVTASVKAADWTDTHLDAARTVFADILKKRGDNPDLARYWTGYGLRQHALYTDHDGRFWIDALVRSGRLKPGQYVPADIQTNRYNAFAQK